MLDGTVIQYCFECESIFLPVIWTDDKNKQKKRDSEFCPKCSHRLMSCGNVKRLLEYPHLTEELMKYCNKCDQRFKCWTER